ncbi:hypothetical protein QYF36_009883 [Acer negundo]|nr:hypothetical protein QYF36_009883 [Acer negundo]
MSSSSKKMSLGNMNLFTKGTLVEMSSDKGWIFGGCKFVRNCVDIKFVRPLLPPPPNDEQEQQRCEVNDVVDAYCIDGWWVGVVSKVLPGEEEQRVYSVLLENQSHTVKLDSYYQVNPM